MFSMCRISPAALTTWGSRDFTSVKGKSVMTISPPYLLSPAGSSAAGSSAAGFFSGGFFGGAGSSAGWLAQATRDRARIAMSRKLRYFFIFHLSNPYSVSHVNRTSTYYARVMPRGGREGWGEKRGFFTLFPVLQDIRKYKTNCKSCKGPVRGSIPAKILGIRLAFSIGQQFTEGEDEIDDGPASR